MTDAERDAIVKRLSKPFEVREIKWRVTNTSNEGRRGVVMPYADPRAYKDRLNEVLSTAGWSESYSVTVIEHSIRRKGENPAEMLAGKILVTCKVVIPGIGEHSGTGEEWSDADCAMTSADAQAFKRACSSFGLGRYLYSIPEQWMDLDHRKRPKSIPSLPDWARPARQEQAGSSGDVVKAQSQNMSGRQQDATRPTRQTIEAIESYREHFGDALYLFHLTQYANVKAAGNIRDAETAEKILGFMNRTFHGMEKARDLGEGITVGQFDYVMNRLGVKNLNTIPDVPTLISLVRELERVTARAA